MDSFLIALNAVFPFLFYISFGYMTRAIGIVDEAFMKKLNQMTFQMFFPLMMFYNLYDGEPGQGLDCKLIIVAASSVIILITALFLLIPKLVKENPRRGVLIQGIYRSNFVLFAIPLTENIFGRAGTATASMLVAVVVPIYNVSAVIILEYFRGGNIHLHTLIKKLLSNPLIIGAIAGAVFILMGLKLPSCIEKPVSQFAAMTTPLALFVLGGTLRFSSMKNNLKYLIPVLTAKLLLLPAAALAVSSIMSFGPLESFVYFTMFATPVAAASYPMASNMGGDSSLAGELVVLSTCLSVITIFLWVFFMNSYGFI